MKSTSHVSLVTILALAASAGVCQATFAADKNAPRPDTPLSALIVGGGPDIKHNQVAIESNVVYVRSLLPPSADTRILFADGNPKSETVLYENRRHNEVTRAPKLPALDAPTVPASVESAMDLTAKTAADKPSLLYFTGHGSPNDSGDVDNNKFDMWDKNEFTVKNLASSIGKLPAKTPVTVVMAQCFSGSFGNLIFQNGDPVAPLTDRNICGFFASIAQRPAAGCTTEINQKNYRDFTSYFFAALSGEDRLGKLTTGADYNNDGKVGMDEAFAYTIINDDSIDTPVCTSDVFLRRYAKISDDAIFKTPYSQVIAWATPGQHAAIEALSDQLKLTGDGRVGDAYKTFATTMLASFETKDVRVIRFVRLAKTIVLSHEMVTNGDESLKARYDALKGAEAGNPLTGPAAPSPLPAVIATPKTPDAPTPAFLAHQTFTLGKMLPPPVVTIDVTDAPETKAWAENAQKIVTEWFPLITPFLATDHWKAPKTLKLILKHENDAPAYTDGDGITISAQWITDHPDDFGMVIHELTHVIQGYPDKGDKPGWLVEGIADYIRFWRYESDVPRPRIDPTKAKYTDAYRTTAAFIAWAQGKYDRSLILRLDGALKTGDYHDAMFEQITGKNLDALWSEFIKTVPPPPHRPSVTMTIS
ncbi:MAG: hypothetical protein JWQ02_1147 [Capsulimonas sp.]|nr:hypothetical protein [Capsulimonas sp.]